MCPEFFVHQCIIEKVSSCKFLGLTINSSLDFKDHVNNLSNQLSSSTYLISKLSQYCSRKTLLSCYYGYVYSRLKYNIISWGAADQYLINRIFVFQKRIIRIIFKIKPRDSCKPLFKEHNILTLPAIVIYECSLYVYTHSTLFKRNYDYHTYETRNKNSITLTKHAKQLFETSPHYFCSKIFNSLPANIRNHKNINSFRKSLKQFLINNCFYTLNEYLHPYCNT